MNNFTYSIPTTVFFGKGQVENLPGAIKQYGKKVLMVYGGGSIKKMGLYDKIVSLFKENGIEWVELNGVEPNPRVTSVNKGVQLCRENGVEAVLPQTDLTCFSGITIFDFHETNSSSSVQEQTYSIILIVRPTDVRSNSN